MDDDLSLPMFEPASIASSPAKEAVPGKPRILEPQRVQGEIRFEIPDDMLPESHAARLLWNVLGTLNLAAFSTGCEAVEGKAGRSLLSPRMLLTLWLYAVLQGVGSAREIARLIKTDVAYRWIVGNVKIGHHKLSEFRIGHGEALSTLMTDVLARGCCHWIWWPTTARAHGQRPQRHRFGRTARCWSVGSKRPSISRRSSPWRATQSTRGRSMSAGPRRHETSRSVWKPRLQRWASFRRNVSHRTIQLGRPPRMPRRAS